MEWGNDAHFLIPITEAVTQRCSVAVSFFNKVVGLRPATFIKKEALGQVFCCKFCEISKNTFSYRATPVTLSAARIII